MATSDYVQTNSSQACALNNYCSAAGGTIEVGRVAEIGGSIGTTAANVTVGSAQSDDNEYSFECVLPTNAESSAENATVSLNFSLNSMNVTWASCWVCRVNSSCVNQETIGSNTSVALITNAGSGLLSTQVFCSSVAFAAGDKAIITIGLTETGGHASASVGVTPDQTMALPFNAPAGAGVPAAAMTGNVVDKNIMFSVDDNGNQVNFSAEKWISLSGSGFASLTMENNDRFENIANGVISGSTESSSITDDPLFADPNNEDWTLDRISRGDAADSPAYTEGFTDVPGVTDGAATIIGTAGYDRSNY